MRANRILEALRVHRRSISGIARQIGVPRPDVSNFIAGKRDKVGKTALKKIREYFISIGAIAKPKVRPKSPCPGCGRMHVCVQTTQKTSSNQSQTAAE